MPFIVSAKGDSGWISGKMSSQKGLAQAAQESGEVSTPGGV